MLPIISIYNFTISSYSIMFAIGILFSFLLIVYIKKIFNVKTIDVICCFPHWLICFFIGAKLFYLIENINLFFNNYNLEFRGGFSFTGGIIGGLLGIFLYCKYYKIKYKNLLQIYVIAFPLTYSFGKIGCFLVGCCNAKYTIPLQLIESLISFIIFIYIFLTITDSSIVYQYLMLYSTSRFIFDFLREKRIAIFMNFSFTQLICIVILIINILQYWAIKNTTL